MAKKNFFQGTEPGDDGEVPKPLPPIVIEDEPKGWLEDAYSSSGFHYDEATGKYTSFSYTKDGYGGTGRSASAEWSSRFEWFGDDYYSTLGEKAKFLDILNTVSRSANVLRNAPEDGVEERRLICRWSDGSKTNAPEDNTIYLSPDVVSKDNTKKSEWTSEQLTDVLIGEALSAAAMKVTITPKGEQVIMSVKDSGAELRRAQKFQSELAQWQRTAKIAASKGQPAPEVPAEPPPGPEEMEYQLARRNWFAAETLAAQRHVLEEFPGFRPYLSSKIEYHTGPDAMAGIVENFKSEKTDGRMASDLMTWQIFHPDLQLPDVPEPFKEAVADALKILNKATTCEERAKASIDIGRDFYKRFGYSEDYKDPGNCGCTGHGDTIENSCGADLADMVVEADGSDVSMPEDDSYIDNQTKVHRLNGDYSAKYRSLVTKLTPQINALRNRLKLRNELPHGLEHALLHGRLDEGSIYKVAFHKSPQADNRMFEQEEIIEKKKIAVGLLIDESGSMSSGENSNSAQARDLAIILANTFKHIDGVNLSVLGHTGQGTGQEGASAHGMLIHEYFTPETKRIETLAAISGFCQNLDGYAIYYTVRKMLEWFPEVETKMVIHISDGYPAGNNYGGNPAMMHMRRVSDAAKAKGVTVVGIGVGAGFTADKCDLMYGSNHWVHVKHMAEASLVISNLLTRVILANRRGVMV